jgi:hypothetical protein
MSALNRWVWLVASLLVGLVVWIVLPNMVVVFNDDFGYLRSVVATLQHGRPWTDDWLAASLSLVSGLIYKATGSFSLATQGLQAAMAGVSFLAMTVLFVRRAMPTVAAMATAAVILFVPTLIVKWLEFTALIIYVPCLLWAIYLAEKQRWAWFFVVWVVAVASRQSALAWLALPGVAVIETFRLGLRENRSRAILPLAVCLAGVVAYLLIGRCMNETHAQRFMMTAMWRDLAFGPTVRHFAFGVVIFLTSVGCAAFVMRAFCSLGKRSDPVARKWSWSLVARVLAAVVVLGLYCFDPRTFVAFEHPFYSGLTGRLFLGVLFGLGVTGWFLGGFRLQPHHVVCAAGSALIASLRGVVYDYYLLDVAIIGVFSVLPANVSTGSELSPARRTWPILAVVGSLACMTLAGFEFFYIGKEQRVLDRYAAVIRLCEPALREGRIAPSELSAAPFGYIGWHLYPYFIRHDGANGAYIADFENYLNKNGLAITFTPCSNDQQKQGALMSDARGQAGVLDSGIFKVGWRGPFLFVLRRTDQPLAAKLLIDPLQYRVEPFPLNDAEWRQLIVGSKPQ